MERTNNTRIKEVLLYGIVYNHNQIGQVLVYRFRVASLLSKLHSIDAWTLWTEYYAKMLESYTYFKIYLNLIHLGAAFMC